MISEKTIRTVRQFVQPGLESGLIPRDQFEEMVALARAWSTDSQVIMQKLQKFKASEPPQKSLMDTKEAAAYLGVRAGTLSTWRCTKLVKIPYVKVGGLVRYRLRDLEAYLEERQEGVDTSL